VEKILITGGAGFIGCNLADRLMSQGVKAIVLDSLKRPGSERNLQWLRERHHNLLGFYQEDVMTTHYLLEALDGADAVFHLAAQTAVTTSLYDPVGDFAVNVGGTLAVLEAMRMSGVQKIIAASTNKVYGHMDDVPVILDGEQYRPTLPGYRSGVPVSQQLQFVSPYGCSKGAADQYVLDYARSYGLQSAVMRMSCIYGTHQNGTEDQGWVAHFLMQALHGKPITIYGDGFQVRDILYIDDCVDAWLAALDRIDSISGRAFNLGGGPSNAVSLKQVIDRIESMIGPIDKKYGDWRVGDQQWYVSDIREASEALGWFPRINPDKGLSQLCAWFQLQSHLSSTAQ
jgi:CDP-paratose 2-epimerase